MGPGQSKPRTNEEKQANERRWREWVRGELAAGVTPLALRAQLVKRGWPRDRAALIVSANQDAARPPRPAPPPLVSPEAAFSPPPANPFANNMLIGGVICVIGIAVSVGTFIHSGAHGGPVIIAWGAIVFGGMQFFAGAIVSVRNRRL